MKHIKLIFGVLLLINMTVLASDVKFGGLTFLHFNYEDADKNEFGIKRAYFTYSNKLNKRISYKFQMDVGPGSVSAYSVYVKNAKVDWKTSYGKITLGIQGMNLFAVQEKTWGYRFIEKSAMDRNKYASSADMGFGWSHKVGVVNTSVIISNGGGYKKAETDGHKKISANLYLGQAQLSQKFNAGLIYSHEGIDDEADATATSVVFGGFGGLAVKSLRIGIEYNIHTVEAATETMSTLFSGYSRIDLTNKLAGYIRYDYFDPDLDQKLDAESYFITGLNLEAEKGLSIAPNIRVIIPEEADTHIAYYLNFQFKF